MKYDITRACGHIETVDVYGSAADRERKIKWLETQDCAGCKETEKKGACKEVEMHYSEYKKDYADCKTKAGSYDKKVKTIIVYVPDTESTDDTPAEEEQAGEEVNIFAAIKEITMAAESVIADLEAQASTPEQIAPAIGAIRRVAKETTDRILEHRYITAHSAAAKFNMARLSGRGYTDPMTKHAAIAIGKRLEG